jgi:hypothetical protein
MASICPILSVLITGLMVQRGEKRRKMEKLKAAGELEEGVLV